MLQYNIWNIWQYIDNYILKIAGGVKIRNVTDNCIMGLVKQTIVKGDFNGF